MTRQRAYELGGPDLIQGGLGSLKKGLNRSRKNPEFMGIHWSTFDWVESMDNQDPILHTRVRPGQSRRPSHPA